MHTSAIWIYVALLIAAHSTSYCTLSDSDAKSLQHYVELETKKSMTGFNDYIRIAMLPLRNVSYLLEKIWTVSQSRDKKNRQMSCNNTRIDVALTLVRYQTLRKNLIIHLTDEYVIEDTRRVAAEFTQKMKEYRNDKQELENKCNNAFNMVANMEELLSEKRKLFEGYPLTTEMSDSDALIRTQLAKKISEITAEKLKLTAEMKKNCDKYEAFNEKGEPEIVESDCFAYEKYKEVLDEKSDENVYILLRMINELTRACQLPQLTLWDYVNYEAYHQQKAELLQRQRKILNTFWSGLISVSEQLARLAKSNRANNATWALTYQAYCNETSTVNKDIIQQTFGRPFNAKVFHCNEPMTVALPEPLCNKIATNINNNALSNLFNATVYDLLNFTSTRAEFYKASSDFCGSYIPKINLMAENLKVCINTSTRLQNMRIALRHHANSEKQLTLLGIGLTKVCSKLQSDAIENNAFPTK